MTVDRTTFEGKTVLTTNTVEEVTKANEQTTTVMNQVVKDYPILENYPVKEITLTDSQYSSVFEITYEKEDTKE